MDKIMTELVTNISGFRKNPNAQVEQAGENPFAVITNNKPSFYVLPPALFDAFERFLYERRTAEQMNRRAAKPDRWVSADITDL